MSTRVEVLLWAGRMIARKGAPPHELLEVAADCTLDQAQDAFHKLAKIAHPDLHRTTLDAGELEKVTTAYAYVAAAYQAIRVARMRGGAGRPPGVPSQTPSGEIPRVKRPSEAARGVVLPGGGVVSVRGGAATRPPVSKSVTSPPATVPPDKAKTTAMPPIRSAAPADPVAAAGPAVAPPTASASMNSKALIYYRKAESALRQGDLRMAVLNLKMAIAADPASGFLRQAMAEVETELKAK